MNKVIDRETNRGDITRPQYSDSALKDMAVNGAALIAIVRMPDLKILFVNESFEYYLGYPNASLYNEPVCFTEILKDHQIDRLLYQFSNVKESIASQSRFLLYTLTSKKKESMPYYIYASLVDDPRFFGEEIYHLTLHPDLSKWNLPFTSFNTRELFLEQFTSEAFGTYEWIIDADKVFWSIGVYHIYDVDESLHDINPQFIDSFVHPNDRNRVKEATKNAFETGADMNIEYDIITAKQEVKTIHFLGRVVKNTAGKYVKFAGSIRDVTEQKIIERDLKNKVELLNHSNRELEEFAYVASHDLQEPLRKITTFSDRLSEKYGDVLTGDGIMYLTRMTKAAENMRRLIKDLLEFSRISKTAQTFEQVNLNTVLQQVMTDLELVIEETATTIHSKQLPTISAISSQMKQLFANIVNNAIKFHKEGVPPVITIDTQLLTNREKLLYELVPTQTYYKIQITDNGIGFEDEYATRIFQVFQRLHGKSEYPGSGIGLAICKKILEYHHGIIYAENVADTGARFVFILPQHQ